MRVTEKCYICKHNCCICNKRHESAAWAPKRAVGQRRADADQSGDDDELFVDADRAEPAEQAMPKVGLRSTSFNPGVSGNPDGRPKRPETIEARKVVADAKAAARELAPEAMDTLKEAVADPKAPWVQKSGQADWVWPKSATAMGERLGVCVCAVSASAGSTSSTASSSTAHAA
jgi:hypothetical protein